MEALFQATSPICQFKALELKQATEWTSLASAIAAHSSGKVVAAGRNLTHDETAAIEPRLCDHEIKNPWTAWKSLWLSMRRRIKVG